MDEYYVYILASRKKGKLYIGITKNLKKRISEHRNDFLKGFTERNKVKKLAYYEQCDGKRTVSFRASASCCVL
jgi:putative endonuclease